MAKVKIESGAVFERYENKYLLDQHQYQRLQECLDGRMERDGYGLHTICTVYYDTDDYAIIRRCLEKPKFKEKLRLRSYGVPAPDGTGTTNLLRQNLVRCTFDQRQQDFHIVQRYRWVQQRQLQAGNAVMLGHTDVRTTRQRAISIISG